MPQQFSIPKPQAANTYLESALARGAKRVMAVRGGMKGDRVIRARDMEYERFKMMEESLDNSLSQIHDAFPNLDALSEFTQHLIERDIELGRVKQALGGLNHALVTIKGICKEAKYDLKNTNSTERVAGIRSHCLGRIASVMRKTEQHLLVLTHAREVFLNLPSIDDTLFTVAIAGFPNVGKSTLLSKLTTAKPEIKAYAFTTKGLNVGYFEYKYNKIQCVDTPGTLNREQMNAIEQKAELTVKYLANIIIYVFDLTEPYPLQDQIALLQHARDTGKTIFLYVSKTDILPTEIIDAFRATEPELFTSPDDLRKAITKQFKEWV